MKLKTLFFLSTATVCCVSAPAAEAPVKQLIPWLLDAGDSLEGIPFADVIEATSGKKVLPVDAKDVETARILAAIAKALDGVLAKMNVPGSPVHAEKRVNEMSAHFEAALRTALDGGAFECGIPKTAAGAKQRSGYPDIRLRDKATGRIFYLDPKLFAAGSRGSSLRTFYFTPRRETNKVNEDAHHLVVGFEHEKGAGGIRFTRWELVDLAKFRVRLKAEFEGSNRDLYRDEAVVGRGR